MNTEIKEVLKATEAFLASMSIKCKIEAGRPATLADVGRFQKRNKVSLPNEFAAFYLEIANGYSFGWEAPGDVFGSLRLPTLDELSEELNNWRESVASCADDPKAVEECVGAELASRAMAIWQTMRSWLPFWDEGNGDHFCLDTKTGAVVYDQHDWCDGFGSLVNTNGIVAGASFTDFVTQWSRFCFLPNKSLWWGEFEKFGAIRWEPQYFNDAYDRNK